MTQIQATAPQLKLHTVAEVLFVSCRMEESAITLYQRALMICSDEIRPAIERILQDEQSHLCRFRSFGVNNALSPERTAELSLYAEQILYKGGLLGAVRDGLLNSKDSLLKLAARSEAESMQLYRDFAKIAKDDVKNALLLIADEEELHLHDLEKQLQTTV